MRPIIQRVLGTNLRRKCVIHQCRTIIQLSNKTNNGSDKDYTQRNTPFLITGLVTTGLLGYTLTVSKKRHALAEEAKLKEVTAGNFNPALSSPEEVNVAEESASNFKSELASSEEAKLQKGNEVIAGNFRPELPCYSMKEVSEHSTKESKIWVVFKEGVYDITDFVEQHPGGEQILIAAGSSVEPFWVLYGIHKSPHVFKILETLRIGNLKKEDQIQVADLEDPYANEPQRHKVLKVANFKPFNAETPPELLCESFLTPSDLFYVRNHLPVPSIDPNTYEMEIELEGKGKSVTFSLEDLKTKFPKTTIAATLMCAGNRRSDMIKIKPVKGLSWGPCAIGNAEWTGVRLRDLLKEVGITEDEETYKHVQFEGLDYDVTATQFGASIPLWKAVEKRGDVILAYEMNGKPLPPDHGYPIRVIVPGVAGVRNVKWLGKIVVSENESASHWQQNDYKGFSPSADYESADYSKAPAIQDLPVISAICKPASGSTVEVVDGKITVKGYAWSGGGQKIIRVDLTIDGGKTWHVACLDAQDSALPPRHWAWTLWSASIPVDKNLEEVEVWCKAVDSCYNTQPESFENIWNFRGVLSNAYHRVKLKLKQ
ncbi:sulfite oxidase-like [Anthonomus grandis grandis]|uniref:sulfite oxidase-like n=1 Tax=Anthonomus grandis grandis TaxID=2921223 RepID=UPI002164FFE5|nr:sulfite oxidase-like [Anthonomus grandis grandis]